jgi:hypothetical protein
MFPKTALILLAFLLAVPALAQSDPCENYQSSPDAPRQGPRKFNVIRIAFASADSYVMVVDPAGHRFGTDAHGKAVSSEIARAFYEDDNTAQMDTNLPKERKAREMTLDYAQSGKYQIILAARGSSGQPLMIKTSTCGRRWSKQITVPARAKGAAACFTLIYDSHAKQEPQLVENDQPRSDKRSKRADAGLS